MIGIKTWSNVALRMAFLAAVILWPAGTWRWWEAWVLIGLWTAYAIAITAFLARHDPALLAERLKTSPVQRGQKGWDKGLMLLIFVAGIGIFIVPGFDVMRFAWSEALPLWAEIVAMLVHVPCFLFIARVLRENTYLSRVVKIAEDRGHEVITTGPYAVVRHPMYSAVIVMVLAMPIALGSRWGVLPAALMVAMIIVRTYFEDRTLHSELEGYPEYAETTRCRLLPGVW